MIIWQQYFILAFAIYSLLAVVFGYTECKKNKNAFGESILFIPLSAWVWGDVLVFGIFWLAISAYVLLKQDWILFLLITSVFWAVRSFGEISYWMNQQFSTRVRNPPQNLFLYSIFQNESVWFVYQILWQCAAVVFTISSIYLVHLWLL